MDYDNKTFYMLHVDGAHTPTARHHSRYFAMLEAERLAKQEKRAVFVLRAETMVQADTQHIYCTLQEGIDIV
jgi:hypothetical protein